MVAIVRVKRHRDEEQSECLTMRCKRTKLSGVEFDSPLNFAGTARTKEESLKVAHQAIALSKLEETYALNKDIPQRKQLYRKKLPLRGYNIVSSVSADNVGELFSVGEKEKDTQSSNFRLVDLEKNVQTKHAESIHVYDIYTVDPTLDARTIEITEFHEYDHPLDDRPDSDDEEGDVEDNPDDDNHWAHDYPDEENVFYNASDSSSDDDEEEDDESERDESDLRRDNDDDDDEPADRFSLHELQRALGHEFRKKRESLMKGLE